MAILAFQQPDKVIMNHATETFGQFEFRPLEPGYGITVGNALRRILLSSLEGYAITSVRLGGVDHEFSTIKGVIEDMTEIILNLKQVRFKRQIEGTDSEKVHVTVGGKDAFTAGDIAKHTTAFQVLKPEFVICNMETTRHKKARTRRATTTQAGANCRPSQAQNQAPSSRCHNPSCLSRSCGWVNVRLSHKCALLSRGADCRTAD